MGGGWGGERIPVDFLAIGRANGLSSRQVEQLWERLSDDPRFHLAPDPERWRRAAFARAAAALGEPRRGDKEQPAVPGRRSPNVPGVGKRTLVEDLQEPSSAPGRRSPMVAGVGKRTLVEDLPEAPAAEELPFRGELEAIFNTSFGDVRAYTNQDKLLAPHGARAAAFRGGVAFAGKPNKALVAHELVHVRQLQTRGTTGDASAAERQADTVAHAVARGAQQVRVPFVATAAVSFSPDDGPSQGPRANIGSVVADAVQQAQADGRPFYLAFEGTAGLDAAIKSAASNADVSMVHDALVEGAKVIGGIRVSVDLAGNQKADVTLDDVLNLFAKVFLGGGLEEYGLPASFGNDIALHPVIDEITATLQEALRAAATTTDPKQAISIVKSRIAMYRPMIEGALEQVATQYRDPMELVELEMKGAIGKLRELRSELASNPDPKLGGKIAHLARYVLMLSHQLGDVKQRVENAKKRGDKGAPLADLEPAGDAIQAARKPIGSESATLQALGNNASLINVQQVASVDENASADPETVTPEEAFAHHTDATMARAQARIASRSASQARELASMKKALVPERIKSRGEFRTVYERWFGFFSKTERDAEQGAYMQIVEIAMQLMPNAGISGLMAMYGTQRAAATGIRFPGAHDGFEGEVGRVGVQRETTVGGDADSGGDTGVDYSFEENAGGGSGTESSTRDRAARDQVADRKRGMDKVYGAKNGAEAQKAAVAGGLAPAPPAGKNLPLALYPESQYDNGRDGADKGWNYLMPVMVMNAAGQLETVYEHKVMREEVARYLIAVSQHMHTVKDKHELRDPKNPRARLGDKSGRSGNVMESSADASKTYGDPNDGAAGQSVVARADFKKWQADAIDVPTAMDQLAHDLEGAMDKFFAGAEPSERLKAIVLDICLKEFSLDEAIWQHFTPEALWEFAKQAMKIAAVFWALKHLGPVGQIVSTALHKAFAAQNDAQLEGIAVQLGGWLEGATQCTSFAQARGWAFAFRSIADTVAQAIRDWLAQKAGGAIGHAFGNAWKPTHSEPRTIGEMREELAPVDRATRREMATQLEANLKPALEQKKPLTPDQHSMWAMLNAVDEQAAARLRSKHTELPALDETSPLGVDVTVSVHTPMNLARTASEVHSVIDAHLQKGQTIQPYRVEVLPDAEFTKRFQSEKGRSAVTVVEDGHAVVYARESVKPDALADEAIHLLQLNDPKHPRLGESIRMLGEATLDQWGKFDVEARKNLFERKLEVEIDAKHRRMAELQPGDPEMTSAQDQLRDLEALQKKVQAIKPEELQAMKASGQMPDYLKDPAWLFSKEKTVQGIDPRAPGVDMSNIKRTPIHDSPAAKLKGAHVELVGQPWSETTTIVASNDGKVTFDPTNPHEITVGARRYVLEDGAQLNVKNGDVVKNGTLLATEPSEQYRLVEVTEGKGRPRERLEYYSKKRGQWVQAGEHSTRRGALVEKAGREQITRELDAELAAAKKSPNAQDPNRLVRYVRVQHQNARGQGFDDVIVEFRGNPPKAKIRIVEIKDYPGRYLQASEMSAIRENLHQNMKALRERLAEAVDAVKSENRPAEFAALGPMEMRALKDALAANEFSIELHVGPTTLVGSESRSGSMLGQLRQELRTSGEFGSVAGSVGKDVLAQKTATIVPDSVNRAATTVNPKPEQ